MWLMVVLQSVVLVSRLPFVALFNYLVGVIAPEFFDSGLPCLETGTSYIYYPLIVCSVTLNDSHCIAYCCDLTC